MILDRTFSLISACLSKYLCIAYLLSCLYVLLGEPNFSYFSRIKLCILTFICLFNQWFCSLKKRFFL